MEKGFESEAAYINVMCSSLETTLKEGFAMLAAVPESLFPFGSRDKNWSLALCPDIQVLQLYLFLSQALKGFIVTSHPQAELQVEQDGQRHLMSWQVSVHECAGTTRLCPAVWVITLPLYWAMP